MKDTTHCPDPATDVAADAPSVMLVDDEADMRWVLQTLLLDSGYQVTEAESGKTFRQAMLKPPPDVVLLDLKLPDASGLDLLSLIRQEWPRTQVIMLTGFASIETAMKAIQLGAYDYQQKPLDYKRLRATIDRALEHRRLRSASPRHDPTTEVAGFSQGQCHGGERGAAGRGSRAADAPTILRVS